MSTEGSESSQIRRFGLYRSIDARTEEFLRLSRKRQMRQGCACAAISTTITVTVVIIVLLIYEYMIAVETSFVQDKKNKTKYITKDVPIADRLDRNVLGFDQDYYERMPLLINALQEVSYTDSETRIRTPRKQHFSKYYTVRPRTTTTVINRFIKRTSPRPFIFEYRSPYPMPFSKANGNSKYWEEQYRNAQRLKNLHDVVKYLEKTLHAKFGDIILPTRTQIAFSGVYVSPVEPTSVVGPHSSKRGEKKSNHNSDPLHIFRPDNPGEINLLADGLRFAPIFLSKPKEIDIKQQDILRQSCVGNQCPLFNKNNHKIIELTTSEEVKSISTLDNKVKSVRIFNSFLPETENSDSQDSLYSNHELDKIYITTSRPVFQFKRRSKIPLRRISYKSKIMPKFFEGRKKQYQTRGQNRENVTSHNYYTTLKSFNVEINVTDSNNNLFDKATNTTATNLGNHIINYPKLNYTNIEDYHIGSSGIVPIEDRTPLSFTPIVTPIVPSLYPYTSEAITTNSPETFKFTPEDAKIPDHYFNIRKSDIIHVTESVENESSRSKTLQNKEEYEANTLIVKLRNMIESTSKKNDIDDVTSTQSFETTSKQDIETTTGTYVPQINGHYRHVKYKNLIVLLQENSEKYRKKRIESLITTRNPTYVPMYVEIKRNRNTTDS